MELQIIMLGTGNAMVTKCYNTCFVLQQGDEYLLVDAGGGNGILSQLEKAEMPCHAIRQMMVTHGHTDHVLGVIWMVRKIAMLMRGKQYEGEFTIYCHDELAAIIRAICKLTLPPELLCFIGNGIVIREVDDGEQIQSGTMDLQFFDIGSTRAKQFGFRALLPNGKTVVCLGDEPYKEVSKYYVQRCDWLLAEAFCLYEDRDIFHPYEKHHSTARDAGILAEQLGVKNLILYHTEETNLAERKARYTAEAKAVFGGAVFVPDDLDRIPL